MNISESVNKILQSENLIGGQFYEVFFGEFPEIKSFFDGVDMQRQAAVLTTSLVLVESIHSRDGAALEPYLKHLGKQHEDRAINAEDYHKWLQAMIKTLRTFHGDDWNDSLEREWKTALQRAIDLILSGYSEG